MRKTLEWIERSYRKSEHTQAQNATPKKAQFWRFNISISLIGLGAFAMGGLRELIRVDMYLPGDIP